MKDLHKKITQGEWYCYRNNDNVEILTTKDDSIVIITEAFDIEDRHLMDQFDWDFQAICKAVNNTYGKGIDPEKISDLLIACHELAINAAKMIEKGTSTLDIDTAMSIHNIKSALQSIKLEDK